MAIVSRRILADNIARMINKSGGPVRGKVRGWALAHDLDARQIDRIVKQQYAITVDTLDELAAAIGCQPWQLLVPNMTTDGLPLLVMSDIERELYAKIRALVQGMNDK